MSTQRRGALAPCVVAVAAALLGACASGGPGGFFLGTVSGRVVDVGGAPVANAAVRAENGPGTVTDGNGEFRLAGLPAGQQARVNFSAPDFAATTKVFPVLPGQDTRQDGIILVSQGAPVTFDTRSDATLALPAGGRVRIPANSLVRANGQPASGMAVARVAVIDPRDFAQVAAGPGELTIGSGAQQRPLTSGGMVRVQLTDAGTGEALDLAPGQRAAIDMPRSLVTRTQWPVMGGRDFKFPPDTVPASSIYLFDLNTGAWRWVDTLATTPGSNFVTGYTPTLGPWINLDKPEMRTCVDIQVLKADGTPNVNVYVVSFGVDYNGYTHAFTNGSGRARLLARRSSTVLVASSGKQKVVNTPGVETPCVNAGTL